MERLTNDFSVSEMSMYSLAHNCCYIEENGEAWYRDYETDISAREFAREILREYCIWEIDDNAMLSDEAFDEEILEMLMCDPKSIEGLTALFYRNLWAMAELRERLKRYEDLEEQGLLVRLPCPIGTKVYNTTWWDDVTEKVKVDGKTFYRTVHKHKVSKSTFSLVDIDDFGKTVFLTQAEAEQKLKEMEESK